MTMTSDKGYRRQMSRRSRDELEAQLAAALGRPGRVVDPSPFLLRSSAQIAATLTWLLGRGPAPLSGTGTVPEGPSPKAASDEEALALDAIYGRLRERGSISQHDGMSVEHTLNWARGGTDRPPVAEAPAADSRTVSGDVR